MHTFIGLGNPGATYDNTRHNAGRMALEHVRAGGDFSGWQFDKALHAQVADGALAGAAARLVLPETFMNRSGETVRALREARAVSPEALTVAHDEIDLLLGAFKISYDRGAGGHHGVESVIDALGTKAFSRIRIGVAPAGLVGLMRGPRDGGGDADYLLRPFSPLERRRLKATLTRAAEAARVIASEGHEAAMNRFN